jgi:hypothetical protein
LLLQQHLHLGFFTVPGFRDPIERSTSRRAVLPRGLNMAKGPGATLNADPESLLCHGLPCLH